MFSAGTSFYGICDLEMLTKDTHKFESHYMETLIGPYPEDKKLYEERSPINYIDQLNCALAIFQGSEDKVRFFLVFCHLRKHFHCNSLNLFQNVEKSQLYYQNYIFLLPTNHSSDCQKQGCNRVKSLCLSQVSHQARASLAFP